MNPMTILKKLICLIPALLLLLLTIELVCSFRTAAVIATDTFSAADSGLTANSGSADETNDPDIGYTISFSMPSGFYAEDFSLTLSGPSGFTIYYTLDGTTPTADSDVYTTPLSVTNVSHQENKYVNQPNVNLETRSTSPLAIDPVEKAYIIRAVGIDEKGVSTGIATATYFVGYKNAYKDSAVISIITDPDNLFDSDTGIYVLGDSYTDYIEAGGDPSSDFLANYRQTGRSWERPAHIDYFDENKNYVLSQESGLRINGNSSRGDSRKSFRLYARKEYDGNSLFSYPFFGNDIYPNSVILRRGIFENQFLQSLVYDRAFDTQKYKLCAVFLDGEFWGSYYLLERYDAEYIESHYHIDADHVTILKDGALFSGSVQSADTYQELLDYMADHDLAIPECYDYVCSQMDIQNYIEYYCTQIYINNYDFSTSKNTVLWRSDITDDTNPYADGRWRFSLMDVDLSLTAYGDIENYRTNSFTDVYAIAVQTDEIMMHALLANPDFRQQFVTTFLDLENQNFRYDTVREKIEEHRELFYYPDIIKEFFENRPAYINEHLATTFGLTGTLTEVTLTVDDASTGSILLNTIVPDLTDGSWSGSYYSDYPVHVTALPEEGCHFKNWIINGKSFSDEELDISLLDGPVTISAVFERD